MKTKFDTPNTFNGVVVLTIALIIVKVLSALYRVPYQNILGDEGLYAYQQVYPIVALGVILTMNAIPSAVTQTFGVNGQASQYTRVLLRLQYIGIVFFFLMFICAHWVALLMGDINLAPMLRAASVSFLFVGVLGVYRGYYQAHRHMNTPAISQVIEQFIRVAIIMAAIVMFASQSWDIYQAGTLAILGSAIGFLVSSLFLIQRRPFKLTRTYTENHVAWKKLTLGIIVFAVSQLIVIVWQVVDSFTIIRSLQYMGLGFEAATVQKGIFDRGASFIQMGLIVTTTFCFVLIPLLTDAIKTKQYMRMNRYANASIKITILFSVSAAVGLINLLPIMNHVFFKNDSLNGTLSIYMLTVICVSLIMMDIALLQVKNQVRMILLAFCAGIVIKTILNLVLIPQLSIIGASLSTVLSLIVFVWILHIQVLKAYHFQAMQKFIFKLLLTMVMLSFAVQIVLLLIPGEGRVEGLVELAIAAFMGISVVIFAIVRLNLLSFRELKHLPFGDKLFHMKRGKR
ncbi:stage V sporulation protein B [Staphylococcus nepalensis]|uniref:polysaccharide biosynthesis protein n=1 Tax=Staphylococcus nepalensis TaxID=214473 RepID=UPI000D58ACDB|nr:polysaccharide biosynthesis protein [Staphylococcus nepalensis]AWI45493.1 stage V sporulation protein B [Staphylococcus nepalensis]